MSRIKHLDAISAVRPDGPLTPDEIEDLQTGAEALRASAARNGAEDPARAARERRWAAENEAEIERHSRR